MSESHSSANDGAAEEAYNPYQAPATIEDDSALDESDPESMRRKFLAHEGTIRGVGFIYLFFGAVCITPIVALVIGAVSVGQIRGSLAMPVLLIVIVGGCMFALGWGIDRLQKWSRPVSFIAIMIATVFFIPVAPVSLYIMYLLFSDRGRVVFSDEYRAVVKQTPHIRPGRNGLLWILLLAFLTMILLAIFGTVWKW